ncbi:MAG: YncE family protein [Patescibacteria group bacterium]|nr:YncE family protein [Patescibacteria group bacterium]
MQQTVLNKTDINQDWALWKEKFGGEYFGHISRAHSRFLENKEKPESLNLSKLPCIFKPMAKVNTSSQPKQVAYSDKYKQAFVSCMSGRKLSIYDCNNTLKLLNEISFKEQCVEVTVWDKLCFVTLSTFSYLPGITDKLAIIDIPTRKIMSIVNTRGSWSKVIKIHPEGFAFISNWHSNDISILDISDVQNPRIVQLLPCGLSPRGIAFSNSGNLGLIACFYSRNIAEIKKKRDDWFISNIGEPFDFPHYSGCMRDILVDSEDRYAYVSNMGRNLVHIYDILSRKIVNSISVGKYPSSIAFLNTTQKKLLVSCRESNTVCQIDLVTKKVEGHCGFNVQKSTGLVSIPKGFLVTNFKENYLEIYKAIS